MRTREKKDIWADGQDEKKEKDGEDEEEKNSNDTTKLTQKVHKKIVH